MGRKFHPDSITFHPYETEAGKSVHSGPLAGLKDSEVAAMLVPTRDIESEAR